MFRPCFSSRMACLRLSCQGLEFPHQAFKGVQALADLPLGYPGIFQKLSSHKVSRKQSFRAELYFLESGGGRQLMFTHKPKQATLDVT